MQYDILLSIIETVHSLTPHFPPTLIFNEGWLLRLVLDWFSHQPPFQHPLAFEEGAIWFSEALLPTAFSARFRGDPLAESRTHLDGVIGHFTIGDQGKADFALLSSATQFIALEAKIYSKLSSTVKNAAYYDQAARNVACMAEALRRADRRPHSLTSFGFYVLAPQAQIDRGIFERNLQKEGIRKKVERRVQAYGGKFDAWCAGWFSPALECIKIDAISWESIIGDITKIDPGSGGALQVFLHFCLHYN